MYRWTFFDYVDGQGQNLIEEWLDDIHPDAEDEFYVRLKLLRNVVSLDRPQVGILSGGECAGLLEIRFKVRNVQYRPLACYGPDRAQVTLLMGATKKNDRFIPPDACKVALRRMKDFTTREGGVCEHRRWLRRVP